jgi:hypothetical protein
MVSPASLASTQTRDVHATKALTISNQGAGSLAWFIVKDDLAGWSDNFDGYAAGSQLHGQGSWKGWANNPAAGAVISNTFATSPPNSVAVAGPTDIIHEFAGITAGEWILTAWQIIPPGFSGDSYFILLNRYSDSGPKNWSTQVQFSSTAGQVINTGTSGGNLPLATNQRIELRVEIDLDNDTQDFFYDGQLLYSGTYTNEVSGGGVLEIAALSLFANSASPVYYDDISLVPKVPSACAGQGSIPWASANPLSGKLAAGGQALVDVTFDSAGLATGVYTGTLCVQSTDMGPPEVAVGLSLTVVPYSIYIPQLSQSAP